MNPIFATESAELVAAITSGKEDDALKIVTQLFNNTLTPTPTTAYQPNKSLLQLAAEHNMFQILMALVDHYNKTQDLMIKDEHLPDGHSHPIAFALASMKLAGHHLELDPEWVKKFPRHALGLFQDLTLKARELNDPALKQPLQTIQEDLYQQIYKQETRHRHIAVGITALCTFFLLGLPALFVHFHLKNKALIQRRDEPFDLKLQADTHIASQTYAMNGKKVGFNSGEPSTDDYYLMTREKAAIFDAKRKNPSATPSTPVVARIYPSAPPPPSMHFGPGLFRRKPYSFTSSPYLSSPYYGNIHQRLAVSDFVSRPALPPVVIPPIAPLLPQVGTVFRTETVPYYDTDILLRPTYPHKRTAISNSALPLHTTSPLSGLISGLDHNRTAFGTGGTAGYSPAFHQPAPSIGGHTRSAFSSSGVVPQSSMGGSVHHSSSMGGAHHRTAFGRR